MREIARTAVAVLAVLLLVASPTRAQPKQPENCARAAPVCAIKAGTKQSYWNECRAGRDGATVVLVGECPALPNSDGGGGGSGGM